MKNDNIKLISTDKKKNIEYWDDIDNVCEIFIREFATYSTKNVDTISNKKEFELFINEIAPEVRDFVKGKLEEKLGAKFPFVDVDY